MILAHVAAGESLRHCCLQKQSVSGDSLWAEQHEASDALTSAMMRYAGNHFSELIQGAWLDFQMGDDGGVSWDSDERMIFMPYFLFHWEAWIHQKIPALGGRTPLQAVRDSDGREMVEALLLGWERSVKDLPGGLVPDLNAIRRLLNL